MTHLSFPQAVPLKTVCAEVNVPVLNCWSFLWLFFVEWKFSTLQNFHSARVSGYSEQENTFVAVLVPTFDAGMIFLTVIEVEQMVEKVHD